MEREAELSGHQVDKERASALRKTELDLIARADASIVVSSHERDLLRELAPQAPVHEIPILTICRGARSQSFCTGTPDGSAIALARSAGGSIGAIRLCKDDRLCCSSEGLHICRTGMR
jgi:hypothetical protein